MSMRERPGVHCDSATTLEEIIVAWTIFSSYTILYKSDSFGGDRSIGYSN
jgi:hypothetical protein